MKSKIFIWIIVMFMLAFSVSGQATIIKEIFNVGAVNGTDSCVDTEVPDTALNEDKLVIGTQGGFNDIRRCLINISFIRNSVPSGATINFLKIEFETDQLSGGLAMEDLTLYPVNKTWDETITHNQFFDSDTLPYGNITQFNGSNQLVVSFSPASPTANVRFNITIDNIYAQRFFDRTLGEYDEGILLTHNKGEVDPTINSFVQVATSDDPVPSERWSIYINYTEAVLDSDNPNFGNTSINNSAPKINEVVALSQIVNDNLDLSTFIFADNRTGSFVKTSPVSISGTSFNATFNMTVNLVRDNVIGFFWNVSDANGNTNQTAISTFTVGNTPPETPTILFPTNELVTFLQPMDINVTFPADADSDSITIFYFIDAVLNQTSATNVTFNASDKVEYTLQVSLTDGIDFSSNTSVVFTIDTINPIITRTLPVNNSLHRLDIPVDLTCTNINLQNFNYVFFNTTNIVQTVTNSSINVTETTIKDPILLSGLGDGEYTMNISCTDDASLTLTQFINLNLDQSAPAISSVLNNNTPEIGSVIQYNGTCSDVNGISLLTFENNATAGEFLNVSISTPANLTPFTSIFNHTSVNGTIATRFACEDAIGNTIQDSVILYTSTAPTVDLTAPLIDSLIISNATPQEDDLIQINVTCTDIFTGLHNVSVANNATGTLTNVSVFNFDNVTTGTLSFNHTVIFAVVAHQFTCADAVNNEAQSAEIIYEATEAPSIIQAIAEIELPLSNAVQIGGMLVLITIVLGAIGIGRKKR